MTTENIKRKGTVKTGVQRDQLVQWCQHELQSATFKDYAPNGLQVQGRAKIRKLVSGVTASARFIEAAIAAGADAILVHHGWFWRGEDPCIVGMKHARLQALIKADVSMMAFHLPLDAHPVVGNNAQLAEQLGWSVEGRTGDHDLVFYGDLAKPVDASALARKLTRTLGQKPLIVGEHAGLTKPVLRRIAWCTGGAQDAIDAAIGVGADVYVSGEISERTTHIAREAGLLYVAAGHHATERYGVQALGRAVASQFGIEHQFIDDPNPV